MSGKPNLLVRYSQLATLMVCLLPLSVSAQSNRFDASRLDRIDEVLQGYVDRGEIAGAVALVQQNGRSVYEHAVCWADKEVAREMSVDSMFRIAS
ncbi:MAG: serine hydrolase, partial [Pseudohongiella sp.]|nr:serine hydrolase [Pseudohongiella sp.]